MSHDHLEIILMCLFAAQEAFIIIIIIIIDVENSYADSYFMETVIHMFMNYELYVL